MLIYLIETWGMWWRCCGEDLLLFHLTNGFFVFFCLKGEGVHRDVGSVALTFILIVHLSANRLRTGD